MFVKHRALDYCGLLVAIQDLPTAFLGFDSISDVLFRASGAVILTRSVPDVQVGLAMVDSQDHSEALKHFEKSTGKRLGARVTRK